MIAMTMIIMTMIAVAMIAAAMADGDDDDLGGDDVGTYLPAMQIIDSALRMRGGGKDRALIAAEYLQPGADIGGMIRPVFELAEIGTQERSAEFGNQLFPGIADIAVTLLLEAAVKARRMPRPVHALMGKRGVVALRVKERLKGRHLNMIGRRTIVCSVPDIS